MTSPTPEHRPTPRKREFLNLVFTLYMPGLAMGLGMGFTVAVLPELSKQLGADLKLATLVFVFQLLGSFAAPLPTGYLIDRLGRRRVLLAGPIVTAVASLMVAKVAIDGSFYELLIYRFVAGWGEQMWMMSRITVIADTGTSSQRGKQVTSMFGVQQVGNLTGPVLGGFAAVVWGLWVPFVMHAVIVLIAVIPSFYMLRETAPPKRTMEERTASGEVIGWRRMLVAPIPAVFAVQFLANITRGGVFGGGVIVLYAAFTYDIAPDELGLLRGAMGALGIPIVFTVGYVMDRFGRKYTMVPGLFLSSAAMMFLAATAYLDTSFSWFIAAFVAVHMSINVISGNMQTLGTDVAPRDARGMFFGTSRTVAQGGATLSPGSFGLMSWLFGAATAFAFLGSAAFIAMFIVLLLIPETLRRGESAPKSEQADITKVGATKGGGMMDYLDEQNRLVSAVEPRWIATPKRVRVYFAGDAVVDSTRANLFRGGGPPVYYFPKEDLRQDMLAATGRSQSDVRGTATLYDVEGDGQVAEDAAWEYVETNPDTDFLKGMVSLKWGAMDAWFEEEEEVYVHARDPFKRIETARSARRVEVVVGGTTVADSRSPVILMEPGHPMRYYLPKMDVRMDMLRPSETSTRCPYKGQANYYSVEVGGEPVADAAWCYKYPIPETAKVAGMVCFFNERVDAILVDGVEQGKPTTAWRR